MRVYAKNEDKFAILPGIIVTTIFLSFSIGTFIYIFKSNKSFIDILASLGTMLIFAIIFFGFGIYFAYLLLKRPTRFKAKLINKEIEIYNGKEITYMKFAILEEGTPNENSISSSYNCYTIGENELIVNNYYSLRIKEFNWEPKYVEEINTSCENRLKNKVPSISMSPIFFALGAFFAGLLFLCILGIIFYPEYTFTYIMMGVFSSMPLCIAFKNIKLSKKDSNVEKNKKDQNLDI